MTAAMPRLTLTGFGTVGFLLGGALGYLLPAAGDQSLTLMLAGAIIGGLVGVGLVVVAHVPRPQDAREPLREADEDHPNYIAIWGILFILTVFEVFVAFVALSKAYIILALLLLAVWKALLVALYYMHLRFEPRRMWLLAASPLPLAIILLIAVLSEGW